MIAALFDMDNTLLTVDTGISWTKFLHRRGELPTTMLAKALYWSTLYKLAVLDMDSVFTRLCERRSRARRPSSRARCRTRS